MRASRCFEQEPVRRAAVELLGPGLAAVGGREHHAVVPDGPAVLVVRKEHCGQVGADRHDRLLPARAAIGRNDDVTARPDRDQAIPDTRDGLQQAACSQRRHLRRTVEHVDGCRRRSSGLGRSLRFCDAHRAGTAQAIAASSKASLFILCLPRLLLRRRALLRALWRHPHGPGIRREGCRCPPHIRLLSELPDRRRRVTTPSSRDVPRIKTAPVRSAVIPLNSCQRARP